MSDDFAAGRKEGWTAGMVDGFNGGFDAGKKEAKKKAQSDITELVDALDWVVKMIEHDDLIPESVSYMRRARTVLAKHNKQVLGLKK